MNEPWLYKELQKAVRRDDFSIVKGLADELYVYTEEQLNYLRDTFDAEVAEYNAE
jgi:hypothetical protein